MIVRPNENRKLQVSNKTLRGLYVTGFLEALTANLLLLNTQYGTSLGFDASQVNIQVVLKRMGKTFTMLNDNLGILGQYCTILSGAKNWIVGTDYRRPAAGVKHLNVRTVMIDFGGFINVKDTDELEVQITCGKNAFNSDSLNVASCYLDINPAFGIGVEVGVMHTKSVIIQASTTRDTFNLGDNIMKVAVLNFEDTDATSQIIQTLAVSSDRYDQSFNLSDLINQHNAYYGKQPFNFPYQQSDPTALNDSFISSYPQSFVILNDQEIDRAAVDITFDGTKVNPSKNALVYTYFLTSVEILQRSSDMEAKHMRENIAKLPASL